MRIARPRIRAALAALAVSASTLFAPAMAAGAAPAERIPFKQDEDDFAGTMWRAIFGTAAIALVAVGVVYYVRRKGLVAPMPQSNGSKPVRVLQSVRTGPRTSLIVVQFGGQRLLLGQGEQGMSVLASEPMEAP